MQQRSVQELRIWMDAWRTYTDIEGQPVRDSNALHAAMSQLEVLKHNHLDKLSYSTMLRMRIRLESLVFITWKDLLAECWERRHRNAVLRLAMWRMSLKKLALAFDKWRSDIEEALALQAEEERKEDVKARLLLRCRNRYLTRALRTWRDMVRPTPLQAYV